MPQNNLPISTFLVCKNAMLREGIRHILSGTPYAIKPGEITDATGPLPDVPEGVAAMFVLDANLHQRETPDAIRRLKARLPAARIVVLADSFSLDGMMAALDAGAEGYCLATSGCDTLVKYLDLVMLGETVFPSAMYLAALAERGNESDVAEQPAPLVIDRMQAVASTVPSRMLSTREAEILHCLMEGAPNKTIARKLDVAEATVKVHVKAILRKIRVTNRTQAAMWAVAHLSNANGSESNVLSS